MASFWQTTRFRIDLGEPKVMGIVNVTPDSFSDGGAHATPGDALRYCERLIEDGAHILDIGGESTRPGSAPLPLDVERSRVLPVLRGALRFNVPVSVDTCKPELMRAALDLGADIVNDVWALRRSGALDAVAAHPGCGVVLMHMHGEPRTMQRTPMSEGDGSGGDVVAQLLAFFDETLRRVAARGIAPERIVLDPGIGFGKTVAQNFALLARQRELLAAGCPLLVGWSRKSSLGAVTGLEQAAQRMLPSVVAALLAVERGARIVRVHDVAETRQALAVLCAARQEPDAAAADAG